jgi:hypothetical protein
MADRRLKAELQPQSVRDPRDDSLFKTEGGSNFLTAERYKEVSGVSSTGASETWGPEVHHGQGFAGTGAPAGTLGSTGQHPQDVRESLWEREGGSNYLSESCGGCDGHIEPA